MHKKAKSKHDPKFMEELRQRATVDPETGNLRFDGMYASVQIAIAWDGSVIGVPWSHVVWFLTHGRWPAEGMQIDHIDDEPMNNRPDNLAEITHAENQHKRRGRMVYRSYGTGKLGYGITLRCDSRDERWYVTRHLSRGHGDGDLKTERFSLGGYDSESEAMEAIARFKAEIDENGLDHIPVVEKKQNRISVAVENSIDEIRKLRTQGTTLSLIAEKTGFSTATIYNVTKDIEWNAVSGENKIGAKLTEEKVREARKLRAEGMAWRPLADRYSVAVNAIVNAVNGKTWGHVT